MSTNAIVGISDHGGWAVLVTATAAASFSIVARSIW
jgi:hypothetical protein